MLGSLVGQNVAQELLLPASERGVSPPNLGDIQVRMHVEREKTPLLQCFGADDFVIRVLGTLKHLHMLLGQVSQLQTGASSFDSLAETARLTANVGELTALIDKQGSNFQAEIQGLQAKIARSIAQPRPAPSDPDVNQLMDDILRLTRKLYSFGTTRGDAVTQREHLEKELQSSKRLVEDLQTKVANSAATSPSGLMDFIMEHSFDRVKDVSLTRPLEHWDPLPTRSGANDDDFMTYDPKDFEDSEPDDDDDETYSKPAGQAFA
ncbi:hypothetical protein PF002_g6816 [Phytophthora fragariae]|uniref:Uncharacterized protein n=1 Tax=Phytophthora fragariae TaxID=53985 RepID=A0A6A3ZYD3_9STRA|nr:hypothetical protein PF002_g6816 [Phytophthora fragariae]